MNTQSNAMPASPLDSQRLAPAVLSETRPMYWSVQRELWEHRSIYIAPLAVAGVVMLGFLISLVGLPRSMRALPGLDPAHQRLVLAMPYSHAALLLILTGLLVGVFYCLDALHGERRDRSILFWKSLPVSDLTTVLSKASIPLVVLPLLIFAIIVALQLIMLLVSSAVLMLSGVGAATLARLPLFQMELGALYGLTVLALWHAPLYGWMLLVSGWARRATFLWVVLPPAAIGIFETIAFHTSHFGSLLKDRLFGFAADAFNFKMPDGAPIDAHFIPLTQFTPGKFLSSPGLWIGLVVAAAFLAAAVRLRRYREPI
jgi:ABC-2 type transport system permease protein